MSETLKKFLLVFLSLICGAVFIVSAVTKLSPIEPFEISLVDTGLIGWKLAPAAARLLIGLELVIAILFLFFFKLRKVTVPFASGLLILFTVYLFLMIQQYGNTGSCGCFGEAIEISPLQGIWKNIGLLVLMGGVYILARPFSFRFKTLLVSLVSLVVLILPFIVNPMSYGLVKTSPESFEKFSIQLDSLYSPDTVQIASLKKGKHVIAFLSAACPHCKIAAKKLVVISKQDSTLPIAFLIYNNPEKLQSFYDDTRAQTVPHLLINDKEQFLRITDGQFPRIYFVNDSVVEYESNYFELSVEDIRQWLAAKTPAQQ